MTARMEFDPSPAATGPRDAMQAAVFHGINDLRLESVPMPTAGPGEAIVRVTMTTICGTDVHILKGEWPVAPGRVLGHEPVGVIHELGPGVDGYEVGDRVLVGAITPVRHLLLLPPWPVGAMRGHPRPLGARRGLAAWQLD